MLKDKTNKWKKIWWNKFDKYQIKINQLSEKRSKINSKKIKLKQIWSRIKNNYLSNPLLSLKSKSILIYNFRMR
jgi:division protein CdvB (Snf7/Vps24/ESCRT-III family)